MDAFLGALPAAALNGRVNLEIVALNHALARPTGAASDPWMQTVSDSTAHKLAISQFTRTTLLQNGADPDRIDVWNLGYTPEIDTVTDARELATPGYRFLHITNSTGPLRFGTDLLLRAFAAEFGPDDDVCLVVKDSNPADAAVPDILAAANLRAPTWCGSIAPATRWSHHCVARATAPRCWMRWRVASR